MFEAFVAILGLAFIIGFIIVAIWDDNEPED